MKHLISYKLFENKSPLLKLKDNIDIDLINTIRSLIDKGKILEISCGNGSDAIELDRLGYDVIATDLNPEYVNNASKVKCIQHDTRNEFPFNDNEFDLTYSRLGLHYFTEDELNKIFKDLSRITSRYLVFTVKLTNNIETGKIIFNKEFWENLTSKNFKIISSKVKTGLLYDIESTWLEIVAEKPTNKLNENKLWHKTIPQFLSWFKEKSNNYFVMLDTETTGLPSSGYEVQLTQLSAIVFKYDYITNKFNEIDSYNEKIKLTDKSIDLMKDPNNSIKKVLSFNHYGEKGIKFGDEKSTLNDFYNWLKQYNNPILMIQNASFDMRYLNIRNPIIKFNNEVIDTKMIIQLYYLPLLQKLAETNIEYKELIDKIGTSSRDNGLISSSMGKIGPALDINMIGYHDSLTDCRITIKMVEKIIDFLKKYQHEDITKYQMLRIKSIK